METNRRTFLSGVGALLGAGVFGNVISACSSDTKGGSGTDAGRTSTDGGAVGDSGSTVTDTGVVAADTGIETDTGTVVADTGVGVDSGSVPSGCETPEVAIGGHKGHTLTVSPEDVAAGTEREYDIQGASPHTHTVIVTAGNFATLATGESVVVTSSRDAGHTHSITISCA